MSNQSPSRRRRIAGERKPTTSVNVPTPQGAPSAQPAPEVKLSKDRAPARAATTPPPAAPRSPGRVVRVPVLAGLALLAIALVVTAVLYGVPKLKDVREADRMDAASRAASAVAERAAAASLSYDYKSLDADEAGAERFMTPDYAKTYGDTYKLVKTNAPQVKAKVVADVKASAVSHTNTDGDRASVLVFVNQTTTSTANGGEPQVALNRVMFDMVRQHGSWLVDKITSY